MAYFRAIAASLFGSQFYLNGTGEVARDFTYIDDVCQSIMLLSEELNVRPFGFNDVVNIGGGSPVTINHLINVVSEKTGKHIDVVNRSSIQEDLPLTQANYRYLQLLTNKKQFLDFEKGIEETISWFLNYPASEVLSWLK
jgi:UDP-glucuronate 4-epimerase